MKKVKCNFKEFRPIVSSLLGLNLDAFQQCALRDHNNNIPTKVFNSFAKVSELRDRFSESDNPVLMLSHEDTRVILKSVSFFTNMIHENPSLVRGVDGFTTLKRANVYLTIYCAEIFFDTLTKDKKNEAVQYIKANGYSAGTLATVLNQF